MLITLSVGTGWSTAPGVTVDLLRSLTGGVPGVFKALVHK